jgi:hypothetical protein
MPTHIVITELQGIIPYDSDYKIHDCMGPEARILKRCRLEESTSDGGRGGGGGVQSTQSPPLE